MGFVVLDSIDDVDVDELGSDDEVAPEIASSEPAVATLPSGRTEMSTLLSMWVGLEVTGLTLGRSLTGISESDLVLSAAGLRLAWSEVNVPHLWWKP